MARIDVDSEAYSQVHVALRKAADNLRSAGGRLPDAVPITAFGPLALTTPVAFGQLGMAVEGASAAVGAIAGRTADGITRAIEIFESAENAVRADLNAAESEL